MTKIKAWTRASLKINNLRLQLACCVQAWMAGAAYVMGAAVLQVAVATGAPMAHGRPGAVTTLVIGIPQTMPAPPPAAGCCGIVIIIGIIMGHDIIQGG